MGESKMTIINWNPKGRPCAFTIATINSSLAPTVDFLRNIRDNRLRRSRIGTLLVNSCEWIYYKITPEVAKVISKNHRFKNFWKKLVVTPVVIFSQGFLNLSLKCDKKP